MAMFFDMPFTIQELDPPPWLNRMRELGYPPGYLGNYIKLSVLLCLQSSHFNVFIAFQCSFIFINER